MDASGGLLRPRLCVLPGPGGPIPAMPGPRAGPSARAAASADQSRGIATDGPATATSPGVPRHGDVRRRRGQRDHAHRGGQLRHLRCQVRSERRAGLGQSARVAPSATTGVGIATDERRQQLRHRVFPGTATFGAGEANETTLTSAGDVDIFVARYDRERRAGLGETSAAAPAPTSGFGIATDGAGDSYVTGVLPGTATFGAGEANETTLTSAGASTSSSPSTIRAARWSGPRRAGGTGDDEGLGIATDSAGNSYVIGFFQGTATFGAGEANETTLTSSGCQPTSSSPGSPPPRPSRPSRPGRTASCARAIRIATRGPIRGCACRRAGDNRVVVGFDQAAIDGFGERDHRDPGPDHFRERRQLGPEQRPHGRCPPARGRLRRGQRPERRRAGLPVDPRQRPGRHLELRGRRRDRQPADGLRSRVGRRRFRPGDRRVRCCTSMASPARSAGTSPTTCWRAPAPG